MELEANLDSSERRTCAFVSNLFARLFSGVRGQENIIQRVVKYEDIGSKTPAEVVIIVGEEQENPEAGSRRNVLKNQLLKNEYDCMICQETILSHEQIWHCRTCFNVFHLECIVSWAISSMAKEDDDEESIVTRCWNCPSCRSENNFVPDKYICFCGARRSFPTSEYSVGVPHSCGELCNRQRSTCAHYCPISCHPGPCPPCKMTREKYYRKCNCGSRTITRPCTDTETTFSCERVCGKVLGCGRHLCAQRCHSGMCVTCALRKKTSCCCGKVEREDTCPNTTLYPGQFYCGDKCKKYEDSIIAALCCPRIPPRQVILWKNRVTRILFSTLSVILLTISLVYWDDCPAEPGIPKLMIGIALVIMAFCVPKSCTSYYDCEVFHYLKVWILRVLIWVLMNWLAIIQLFTVVVNFDDSSVPDTHPVIHPAGGNYFCNKYLYLVGLWTLTFPTIIITFGILCIYCICNCKRQK